VEQGVAEAAMTEREKMLTGRPYVADIPELVEERRRCKALCHALNAMDPMDTAGQEALLRRILGGAGSGLFITPPFWCDYGCNITVGSGFYANHGLIILDAAAVSFGDNVFIGPNCGFYTAGHPLSAAARRRGEEYALPISVGSDVWFGGGVQVLPGVSIGGNTVIGAGSVVTRDIPSGVVAAGNPCRALRPIPPEEG